MQSSNPKHVKILLSILGVVIVLAVVLEFYFRAM